MSTGTAAETMMVLAAATSTPPMWARNVAYASFKMNLMTSSTLICWRLYSSAKVPSDSSSLIFVALRLSMMSLGTSDKLVLPIRVLVPVMMPYAIFSESSGALNDRFSSLSSSSVM